MHHKDRANNEQKTHQLHTSLSITVLKKENNYQKKKNIDTDQLVMTYIDIIYKTHEETLLTPTYFVG